MIDPVVLFEGGVRSPLWHLRALAISGIDHLFVVNDLVQELVHPELLFIFLLELLLGLDPWLFLFRLEGFFLMGVGVRELSHKPRFLEPLHQPELRFQSDMIRGCNHLRDRLIFPV